MTAKLHRKLNGVSINENVKAKKTVHSRATFKQLLDLEGNELFKCIEENSLKLSFRYFVGFDG